MGTRYFTTAALHGQRAADHRLHEDAAVLSPVRRDRPASAGAGGGGASCWPGTSPGTTAGKSSCGRWLGMVVESVVLSLPLLLVRHSWSPLLPSWRLGIRCIERAADRRDMLIMSMGAGVYEEFVFRLILFTLLEPVLRRRCSSCNADLAILLMVVMSALLFSAYHYLSPSEHFSVQIFAFRTVAGHLFWDDFSAPRIWHNRWHPTVLTISSSPCATASTSTLGGKFFREFRASSSSIMRLLRSTVRTGRTSDDSGWCGQIMDYSACSLFLFWRELDRLPWRITKGDCPCHLYEEPMSLF